MVYSFMVSHTLEEEVSYELSTIRITVMRSSHEILSCPGPVGGIQISKDYFICEHIHSPIECPLTPT